MSWVVVHHGSGKTWGVEWQAWVRKDPTNWLFVPNLLTTSNFLRSFYPFYPRSCVLKNGQLASWQFFCIIRLYTEDAVESRLPSHTPGEVGTVITILPLQASACPLKGLKSLASTNWFRVGPCI